MASRVVEVAVGVAGTGVITGLLDELVTRFLTPSPNAAAATATATAGATATAAAGPDGEGAAEGQGAQEEEGGEVGQGGKAAGGGSGGGRVVDLALHPHANFVLQAVLGAARTPTQVRPFPYRFACLSCPCFTLTFA